MHEGRAIIWVHLDGRAQHADGLEVVACVVQALAERVECQGRLVGVHGGAVRLDGLVEVVQANAVDARLLHEKIGALGILRQRRVQRGDGFLVFAPLFQQVALFRSARTCCGVEGQGLVDIVLGEL